MGKRRGDGLNPYDGVPGFFGRLNRFVYTYAGPAQVGIGRPEDAATPTAEPRCPICGALMADHVVTRGDATRPTYLRCPSPPTATEVAPGTTPPTA
ncbi:hypothetical protein [Frigoribacterium salinisoli]